MKETNTQRFKRLNIPLFKKVRDRLIAVPESYDQRYFFRPVNIATSPCATVECVAGETLIASQRTLKLGLSFLQRAYCRNEVWKIAKKKLGLTEDEARILFSWSSDGSVCWPEPFAAHYDSACLETMLSSVEQSIATAAVAVEYLNWIIKTGKVSEGPVQ